MTRVHPTAEIQRTLPVADILAIGQEVADIARATPIILEIMNACAGPGVRMTSLTIEASAVPISAIETIQFNAWAEKRTKTLAFVSAAAHYRDAAVIQCSAIFVRNSKD